MEATTRAKVVGPRDGKAGSLGTIGARFMLDGADAGERFSIVEHPMPPRALGAPLHRHSREDEYSYVIAGRVGALLGDEEARLLEVISPAGFEGYFAELVDLGGALAAEPETLAELCARYGLEMDPGSVPGLIERFELRPPGEPG